MKAYYSPHLRIVLIPDDYGEFDLKEMINSLNHKYYKQFMFYVDDFLKLFDIETGT